MVLGSVTWAGGLSGCSFILGPPIDCQSISAEDCRHAVDMARPLLSLSWDQASQVLVHPGECAGFMRCLATAMPDERHITVELISDNHEPRVVFVDRQHAAWTATCLVFVASGNGGHTEACAGQ